MKLQSLGAFQTAPGVAMVAAAVALAACSRPHVVQAEESEVARTLEYYRDAHGMFRDDHEGSEPTLDATYSAFQLAGAALRQNREANTRLLETLGENWLSDPGGADPVALYQAEWVSQQIEPDRYPAGPAVCQKHDAIPHGGGWEAPVAAVATAHLKRAIGCEVSNVEVEPWPVNSMEAEAAALSILQFEDLVSNPEELHAAWPNLADDFITALPEYSGPVSLVTSALRASNFRSQFAPEDRADLVAEIMDACESPALGADIFIDGEPDGSLCSIQTASELRMAGMLSW